MMHERTLSTEVGLYTVLNILVCVYSSMCVFSRARLVFISDSTNLLAKLLYVCMCVVFCAVYHKHWELWMVV